MANKRILKKDINYVTGELLAECISCMHFNKVQQADVDNVMLGILNMQDDMICRISHVEPGMKAKLYFKKLRSDMSQQVEDIIGQINDLG